MKKLFSIFTALLFVGSMMADQYLLVTDASTLSADDQIIIVNEDNDYALGTNQATNNRTAVSVTLSNGSIVPGNTVQIITLGTATIDDNTFWTLKPSSTTYLYSGASDGNKLKTKATLDDSGKWSITIDGNGVASVLAQANRPVMRYNPNNGSPIFNCYATTSTTGTLVRIYKKASASAPTITTQPVGASYSVGDAATALSIAATASSGNLSYQWYSNTENSAEGASSIEGAQAATYTPSTASAGTTYYFCVVTDSKGSTTSNIVAVIVSTVEDPTITFKTGSVEVGYKIDLDTLFESNSTGAVTYSITAGSEYASLSGSLLTGVAIGNVTVQASQAKAAGYNAKTANSSISVIAHVVKAGTYTIDPLGTDFWGCEAINKNDATEDEINFTGAQDDVTLTIKNGSKKSAYINSAQTRVYSDGYTMKFEAPTGFVLTAIAFTAGDNTWAGTHTADVGTMTNNKNWAGTASSVTITFGGTCRIASVSFTYIETPSVANPTISGETPFLNSSTITLECETDGATIYYTLDGEDPDNTATEYTAPFNITATTTVKAIAYKDAAHSDILSMTFTKGSTITVAEALELPDKTNDVFVAGIVSGIITEYTLENGYASYYISDDGTTTAQLQCYKGIGEGIDVLAVGDKVIVKGDYTTSYGKELKANNTLKSRSALSSVAIDDSEAAKAYEAGDEFELDKVKATATFADATTLDVTDWATWTPASAPTISANGNVDVTATWCGKVGEKSIAVTVNTHSVTVAAGIENGTIKVYTDSEHQNEIAANAEFAKGTTLYIVATPDPNYKTALILVNTTQLDLTKELSFTMPAEDVVVDGEFTHSGWPTSVDNTELSNKAVKFIQNGQLFIELNGHIYNVQGQVVK